jgi:hypothetical protein
MSQPYESVAENGIVRIFVGATPAEWLPVRVLEFSIRETTSLSVDVAALYQFKRAFPIPQALANRPRTPFSFQRVLIPELCGFFGKAIYLDADMQVFQDIGELWACDFNGHDLLTVGEGGRGRHGQFSVMVLDCAELSWRIEDIVRALDDDSLDYAELMYEMKVARRIGYIIPAAWNSLEHYGAGDTCLLHYTDMPTQPWVSCRNPLGHLWLACLRRAIAAGFIVDSDIAREISSGHVRPSLVEELSNPSCTRSVLSRLDKDFSPPFRSIQSGKGNPWKSWVAMLNFYKKRVLYRLTDR